MLMPQRDYALAVSSPPRDAIPAAFLSSEVSRSVVSHGDSNGDWNPRKDFSNDGSSIVLA
jgi:hypothetical protein